MITKIKAVLFDLDGILADTEQMHKRAFLNAFAVVAGYPIFDEIHDIHLSGHPTKVKIQKLIDMGHLSKDIDKDTILELKARYTERRINDLEPDRYRINILKYLTDQQIVCACVTNSNLDTATKIAKKLDLLPYLSFITSAYEGSLKPKPAPDGYLLALNRLRMNPDEVIAIEDTAIGYTAARTANINKILMCKKYEDLNLDLVQRFVSYCNGGLLA